MKKIFTIILVAIFSLTSMAQDEWHALKFHQATSFFNYEMSFAHQQYTERKHEFENAMMRRSLMKEYVIDARNRMLKIANLPLSPSYLKSYTVGIIKGNGFNVEKIVFQDAPGRYVTAHLYLPSKMKGRIPACIEMCGHGLNGKGDGSELAERMTINGIAVMVVDPIGQGERQQIINNIGKNKTRGVTTEHTLLTPAFLLLGSSLTAQEYFDNSSAITYLQTRKDIDANKIGCYGFSGGGTQSAYLISMDDRIKAGCVGLFFSSRERTLEIQGPSDGCQWIPYEGREHIELSDMAMMNAPKPFLILDGKYDFVDHFGALQGFDELKRCYTLLGYPDRVEQYYCEDGHATPIDVQLKMVRFFKKWLQNDSSNLISSEYWQGKNMSCTKSGQVNIEFKDAKSTMEICEEEMDKLAKNRENFCKEPIDTICVKLRHLLGIPNKWNNNLSIVETGHKILREYEEYRYQLNCEGEYPIPVIIRIPSDVTSSSDIIMHLSDQGKGKLLSDNDRTDAISNGTIHVYADLRGIGESTDLYQFNYSKYWNNQYRTAITALHTGHPLLGQRVTDIHTLLNFLSSSPILKNRKICIESDGTCAVAVIHAVILDNRIDNVSLSHTLKTWRSYIENPMQRDMMPNVLIGVLHYYDIPDLIKLSKGKISFTD